jgi:K+:H+ antiporter
MSNLLTSSAAGPSGLPPMALLLCQMTVVIAAARLTGLLFRRLGQAAVVGEIFAGVLLGPSLLGWVLPQAQAWLFPDGDLAPLSLLAQLGVLLFMFGVGLELHDAESRQPLRAALIVSQAGMILPFVLGLVLAVAAFPSLAPPGIGFVPFALFFAVSLSVTAFPVLARILDEQHMTSTPLGRRALACAAIADVTAWCALAAAVALARAQGLSGAAMTAALALLFAGVLFGLARPLLGRLLAPRPQAAPATALILMLACAAFTDTIGIHAVFGAFLAGVAMPAAPELRLALRERLQGFGAVLMPLFFALSGLHTRIGSLSGAQAWLLCAAIVAVAVLGKGGGTLLAARASGSSWRESYALGVLMNTRGLMELIVLNLGYDLGLLSGRAFTMLVLMALATTCMTGPLLKLARVGAPEPA